MNFFGHAVIAAERGAGPPEVLGSMLPDLASMVGARAPTAAHPGIAAGIRLHHETDRVFHDSPTFRRLEREARARLSRLGMPRAGTLAVAHVGIELLLDAELSRTASPEPYLRALAEGPGAVARGHCAFPRRGDATRCAILLLALRARGIPPGDPARVAAQIARALAPRPRLALDPGAARLLPGWCETTAPEIAALAPQVLGEVREGLAARETVRAVPAPETR